MRSENMGWQCPNCFLVYSPSTWGCTCSTGNKKVPPADIAEEPTVSLSGEIVVNGCTSGSIFTSSNSTSTAYICLGYTSPDKDGLCTKCGNPKWKHLNISHT